MEYLFEMHTHTKEVSTCAVAYAEDLIESYKDSEYAGFVLTNHLNASTFERVGLSDATWDEKIDHFMKGFNAVKEAAGERFVVLLGFELNFYNSSNDYLVYGATEEFLRAHGDLMAMTPKQVVVSGSDFHEIGDACAGGIYFNAPIKNNDDLLRELKSGNYTLKKTDLGESE